MRIKTKSVILVFIGVFLVIVGFNMKSSWNIWNDTIEIPGTKGRNAAIGAGIGAVGGGTLAAVLGGFGVVIAGTGFGLPAGMFLIATAATVGAGAGAICGSATGNSATSVMKTHVVPAYETWQWASIIIIGVILLVIAILDIRKNQRPVPETDKPEHKM